MTSDKLPHEFAPMEMLLTSKIPVGPWLYEPKWDGFRCLAFCGIDEIELRSKSGKSLTRYFPEIVSALKKLNAGNYVLDGELMIWAGKTPSFDHLLQRMHPAATRIQKLSQQTPATFFVFDFLQQPGSKGQSQVLIDETILLRREKLEEFAKQYFEKAPNIVLSPATNLPEVAQNWIDEKGIELDGIIAKRTDMPYQSGNRKGAVKVKKMRTADCVVGGFRYGANSKLIGSLLLGLYDEHGEFHHVGFISGFSAKERESLTQMFEPLKCEKSFTVHIPGGPSRWNQGKESPWVPVKPEVVVEVQYDHFVTDRFRHGTKFMRWRPDKGVEQCKFDQLPGATLTS